MTDAKCTPPDSLVKWDPALFVGFDPATTEKGARNGESAAIEDMVNSMLPPR